MTAILMTMLSTAALAHECMVSNRSQNGEQSVGNSPMWLIENMATAESYEFVFVVVFGVEPTEEMLEQAVQTRGRHWSDNELGQAMIAIAASLLP